MVKVRAQYLQPLFYQWSPIKKAEMKNLKEKIFLFGILFFSCSQFNIAQQSNYAFTIDLSVEENLTESFKENGRLYIFMSTDSMSEPRTQIWPNPWAITHIFAKNIDEFDPKKTLKIRGDEGWMGTPQWSLNVVPKGDYYVQLVWDQNSNESRIDEPGNIYSKKKLVRVDEKQNLSLALSEQIENRTIDEHPLVRYVEIKSDALTKWWGQNMSLKASVLLPHNYDSEKEYPIRYNVAGYGGRYTRVNRLLRNTKFMNWWDSDEAPEIINVFLDGEGPFGDSYQMDSENSGPYGHALMHELIPHIEDQYRGTQSSTYRFVDGCSTGGWVSLGLQLYYPDMFNGVFSYSPDAIAFENYQLINIYKDENAFTNEYGYERPVMRETSGEPMLSMREFIRYENVLGSSNTYLNSGGQFSAHTALYSPKGDMGLPKPLFDPNTGAIDSEVAEHWKKYDFKLYAQENWTELGPKIEEKIYVWMGDMDHFYLNTGTRELDDFLKTTQNPRSDAVFEYSAMEGHCSQFSDKKVLLQIQERMDEIKRK